MCASKGLLRSHKFVTVQPLILWNRLTLSSSQNLHHVVVARPYSFEKTFTDMSLDPYTDKAASEASPQQKADEVRSIVEHVQTAMLTTRHEDGTLFSRAMHPASKDGLVFEFIANNHSGKFDELKQDPACNVSFYDGSNTDWVSVSGQARIIDNPEDIKKIWQPTVGAWFGNLGDGKHTGNYDDPRVSAIQVKPTEIRYWHAKGKVSQGLEIAKAKVTGGVAAPGVLRVLRADELDQLRSFCGKNL